MTPPRGSKVGITPGRLDAYHADVPVEVRLFKLTEEVGEVAEAFIGMQGLFPELPK